LVVWASYLFNRHAFSFVAEGFENQFYHKNEGHGGFLFGRYSLWGWWWYFPAAIALKTPIGTLGIAAIALAGVWRQEPLRRHVPYLIAPPIVVIAAMTWAGIDIGVRYVLPAYPFLLVVCGRVATARTAVPWVGRAVTISLLLAAIASPLHASPRQLAYFNEVAGGSSGGARLLGDSNIDWGQDLERLAAWWRKSGSPPLALSYLGTAPPRIYGLRYQCLDLFLSGSEDCPAEPPATPSRFLAISHFFEWCIGDQNGSRYAWLRKRTPVATIGDSIHVYDIADAPAHIALARDYKARDMPHWAVWEARVATELEPTNPEARALFAELRARR
jgi:hypothetical protein